jgi:G3E family GTPase
VLIQQTALILNLIPQLPKSYKLALLKNEFGDVAVDSQLASATAISGVQELLNGCICCNLVGQLSDALETLANDVSPDRIVIETSGSAFPATLAMEINRLAASTGRYVLDGVMSVVDVENWKGYDDTSYTAKMQARYTDLIVLNKWELVTERRLEDCEDAILALEIDPPTPRTKSDKGWVDKDIIFGLDAVLSRSLNVQSQGHHDHNHQNEVEVLSVTLSSPSFSAAVDLDRLYQLLREPTKDSVYRIKGLLYCSTSPASSGGSDSAYPIVTSRARFILNWAFGRWTFTPVPLLSPSSSVPTSDSATPVTSGQSTPCPDEFVLQITIITARDESNSWRKRIENSDFIKLEDGTEGILSIKRVL